jgi:HK97 gp10 family phage protein
MMDIKINVVNLPEFKEALSRVDGDISKGVGDALAEVLLAIERRAKTNAPVDTGRLRADIRTRIKEKELQGEIYNDVEYAVFVHEGTSRMRGRPYLLDAITSNTRLVKDRIQRRLNLIAQRGLTRL